jgi:hypothetical protein
MLILASNTDFLQIATGSAGNVDVHASWMDNVSGAVAPGRTNTAGITTAAVTTVVPNPPVGVQRNVKTLHIRNKGTANNDVTIIHTDGTVAVELYKVTLQPNGTLQYIDEVGFLPGGGSSIAAPSGATILIESKTITDVTQAPTVDFTKGIDNAFDQFIMRIYNVKFTAPNWLYMRISRDGGLTWKGEDASYQTHYLYISPTTTPAGSYHQVDNKIQLINQMANADYRLGNMINLQFVEPWKGGFRHMFMIDSCVIQETEGIARMSGVGEYYGNPFDAANNPFNGLRFLPYNPGNIMGGTFNLYGIKK